MMRNFKLLRGFNGPNIRRGFTMGAQPRQRRIPLSQIPVPAYYHPELHPIFRHGWRACERGLEIYQCPHTSTDEHTQSLKRAWEYGYTECFNRDREGRPQMTTAMIDNIQQPEEQPSIEELNAELDTLNEQINRISGIGQALGVLPTYRVANGTLVSNYDEYVYLTGWESARAGYTNDNNPHEVPSNEYAFWNNGWNDFMNEH